MAKRLGALVTFKPGVTREQAEAAMKGLDGLIEGRITYPHTKPYQTGRVVDYGKPVTNDKPAAMINEYDDDMGGPVWYIP